MRGLVAANVKKASRTGAGALETAVDFAGVESIKLEWTVNAAPRCTLHVANIDRRRSTFFEAGDDYQVFLGRGEPSTIPSFIGFQPVDLQPGDEDPVRLELIGYTGRLGDLRMRVDAGTYAQWDALAAMADVARGESRLSTVGMHGAVRPAVVPRGVFSSASISRMGAMKGLLAYASDPLPSEYPLHYGWVEVPDAAGPILAQFQEFDENDPATPPTAAVLDADKDVITARRIWANEVFNAALYKTDDGTLLEYIDRTGTYGTVFDSTVYDSYEEARAAVHSHKRNVPLWELRARAANFDLTPGSVVQVTGYYSEPDGYHQVREIRHSLADGQAATIVRFAPPAASMEG